MKTDFYTKAVLTVIALMLTLIAVKRIVDPAVTVEAQVPGSAKFCVGPNGTIYLYEESSHQIYTYGPDGTHRSTFHLNY